MSETNEALKQIKDYQIEWTLKYNQIKRILN